MSNIQFKKNLLDRIERCRLYMSQIEEMSEDIGLPYEENILYKALISRKKVLVEILEELLKEGR